jgi:hypothetical protein
MAGGYFLGRTRKMKLALMLGGMIAGRQAGGPGELLAQGSKLVSSSPELSRLVGDVRGRLLDAGKDAALAVATRQVESWADRVAGRPAADSPPPDEDGNGEQSADGSTERPRADEDTPARARDGAAARSRSGSTATRTRRANSARGSGRTARDAKGARPARAGREGSDG